MRERTDDERDAAAEEFYRAEPDQVCEHGTAMDVHCCNCHSGFIFERDHECPDPDDSEEEEDVTDGD